MTSTLTNPVALSEIIGDGKKTVRNKEYDKRIELIMERLKKKYGTLAEKLTAGEAADIDRAEKSNRECEECQGLPCKYGKTFEEYVKVAMVCDEEVLAIYGRACRYLKKEWQRERLERNLRNAKIPLKYQEIGFESYEVREENKMAVGLAKWCLESGVGLFIHGLPGTGKTMLASIIGNESLKKNRTVIFSKVADLMRNIRRTFSKESKVTEQEILQDLYECDVLVIDDMRTERESNFVGRTLFDVIDYRYNGKKQTIITSNGTLEECCNALNNPKDAEESFDGTRIYDRCKDMMKIAHIRGNSRRGI